MMTGALVDADMRLVVEEQPPAFSLTGPVGVRVERVLCASGDVPPPARLSGGRTLALTSVASISVPVFSTKPFDSSAAATSANSA
ncbi:MAG: hypothetical protein K2Q06_09220 [Parvularculaceae bacterium]|nr:hypothetical protein [Parvularculaceae bacterium]